MFFIQEEPNEVADQAGTEFWTQSLIIIFESINPKLFWITWLKKDEKHDVDLYWIGDHRTPP